MSWEAKEKTGPFLRWNHTNLEKVGMGQSRAGTGKGEERWGARNDSESQWLARQSAVACVGTVQEEEKQACCRTQNRGVTEVTLKHDKAGLSHLLSCSPNTTHRNPQAIGVCDWQLGSRGPVKGGRERACFEQSLLSGRTQWLVWLTKTKPSSLPLETNKGKLRGKRNYLRRLRKSLDGKHSTISFRKSFIFINCVLA